MFGRIECNGELYEGHIEIKGKSLFVEGKELPLDEISYLPPVNPSKIICIGANYMDHIREMNHEVPKNPVIFLKPPSAVIPHEGEILLPKTSRRVDYEGELALVISKKGKDIQKDEWEEYVMGFMCFNDVTARDLQQEDGQWTRAKSFDTFAPMGPFIVDVDPFNLEIITKVNEKVRQQSNTSNLIFHVPELIEFISHIMTLEKGDVISTGTPSGVGPLNKGDVVEVMIEKIGTLRNYVR